MISELLELVGLTRRGHPAREAPLEGTLRATGAGKSRVELTLKPDGSFTLVHHEPRDAPELLATVHRAGNGLRTLTREDGQAIVGRLAGERDDRFNFQLTGGGPGDPGPTFRRGRSRHEAGSGG
jgi:hypothetical protein